MSRWKHSDSGWPEGGFTKSIPRRLIGVVMVFIICIFGVPDVWSGVDIPANPLGATAPVPNNLVLTPSVEFPTIISVANLGDYSPEKTYVGYFDSNKCYAYYYSFNENERHFYPYRKVEGHACNDISNVPLWSGNYLNWAVTQTIDPFRKALTGGYRVKDTTSETWLEKARHDRNELFPDRRLPALGESSAMVSGATPFRNYFDGKVDKPVTSLISKIKGLGNRILFSVDGAVGEVVAYNPLVHGVTEQFNKSKVYELHVRVKVCDSTIGLEENCVSYPSGYYKPEGLIQQYSDKLRYSIFGYLNDSGWLPRDGAVLRSNQKYVGPKKFGPSDTSSVPWIPNPQREWDPDTGVLITNPNADEANAMSGKTNPPITNSGVINYLNKFGQMTSELAKSFDPVSELYYAATRYLKGQGGVASYSALSSDTSTAYKQADGFPVVTEWKEPYQYWCQSTAILGIGDVYTWMDKNLPSKSKEIYSDNEPKPKPDEVVNDETVDVMAATKKVFELEGVDEKPDNFTGRGNSAFIAGLAYDNRTMDLRPKMRGKQTAATYWVDVRENQVLEPKSKNQYWLAAKYGGFTVPEGFDPKTRAEPLPEAWWWTNGQTLSTGDKKPDNFFVASDATEMVSSLKKAFKQLVEGVSRSGTGVAVNSTSMVAGTMVFQASYDTGNLTGDLKAIEVDPVTGGLLSLPKWVASGKLASVTAPRTYIFFTSDGTSAGYGPFNYSNLSAEQKGFLSEAVVNYIRGSREGEGTVFRKRSGLLGTIVNSQPVVVGKPIRGLYATASFTGGGGAYNTHANTFKDRTPVVYVGANDGMLHGFNANTGEETYAYIPKAVLPNLAGYGNNDYSHRFFVDGKLTVADAYITNGWKTVLVGTLGAGGRGVFALDVSDPANVKFLWEKSAADIPALGNVLSKPVIAQVADGDWRVLLGNGPNGSGDSSQLIMISLRDGSVTTVDTGASGDNGLSGVYTWDADRNGFVDTVYAGDLTGRLWRFAGLTSTPVASLMFRAKDAAGNEQPITATPLVGKSKATSTTWVWFGTGRYVNNDDLTDRRKQTWYGLIDTGTETAGRSELAGRTDIKEVPYAGGFDVRVFPEAEALGAGQKGWYVDLPEDGERMVLPNLIDGRVLVGMSRIPDTRDPCAPEGTGYVMFINPFTGGRLSASYLDISRDGYFTSDDLAQVEGQRLVVSGIGLDSAVQGTVVTESNVVTSGENQKTVSFAKSGTRGVTRSSWRELRRP